MQQIEPVSNRRSKAMHNTEDAERLARRLRSQGYEAEQNAVLKGKSGADHGFDMLARKSDGLVDQIVAAGLAAYEDGQEITLGEVFTFDDRCYDCGIRAKVLVAFPRLDSVAARFAHSQRIIVFDKESLEAFLASPPSVRRLKGDISTRFATKLEFLQSLEDSGYRVEENANVKGKSDAEYTFDILAEQDEGFMVRRVGIDVITDSEVSLSQVSLFDSKAYDSGIYEKVLLTSGELSFEAGQFAQQQRIKIIRLGSQLEGAATQAEVPKELQAPAIQTAIEQLLAKRPEAAEVKLLRRAAQPEALKLIPETMARRFNAMPVAVADNALQVAMANPADIFALQALALQSRMRIQPVLAGEKEIQEAIDFNYRGFGQIQEQVSRIATGAEETDMEDLIEATADAPVASALRLIIDEAVKARASDIHRARRGQVENPLSH